MPQFPKWEDLPEWFATMLDEWNAALEREDYEQAAEIKDELDARGAREEYGYWVCPGVAGYDFSDLDSGWIPF